MLYNRREFISTATHAAAGVLFSNVKPLRSNPDVIVLGAGIAGLYATMLLEAKGYKVQILEGNTCVGGRLAPSDILQAEQYFTVYHTQERIVKLAKQLQVVLEENTTAYALAKETLLHIA